LSDWRMRPEVLRTTELTEKRKETDDVTSLYFFDELCSQAAPGQYVMVWKPGVGEVPMSLSTISTGRASSITVRSVGEASTAICNMEIGDKMGVRGPFGKGFTNNGRHPLLVGGGTGMATLAPLARKMIGEGLEPVFVLGARTSEQLIFREELQRILEECVISTDDGSLGFKGFASECAMNLLKERRFDSVYTCGPEPMMVTIFNEAEERRIPVQASLERYIKCAVGLCGSCAIGPYRICKDGPVFHSEQLRDMQGEFGFRRMDPSGRLIDI